MKADIIFVDYLQLIHERGSSDRYNAITEISIALHELAQTTGILVVALAQLNRNAARAEPPNADLRESGQIEQDADGVIFLYREDYYEKESENHNLAECIIAKNRHGETRTVELQWLPEYTTFSSIDRTHEEY